MSFLAKLQLDAEEYNILHCRYSFNQDTDSTGKPKSTINGGQIELTIESRGSTAFIDWMLSESKSKDGAIVFFGKDLLSAMQILRFEKGYCINFSEEFDSVNDEPMRITIVITAEKISVSNVSFTNLWRMQ